VIRGTARDRMHLTGDDSGPPALSPDGSSWCFARSVRARKPLCGCGAWTTDARAARPAPTAGQFPFWSPDGRLDRVLHDASSSALDLDGGGCSTIAAAAGAGWNLVDARRDPLRRSLTRDCGGSGDGRNPVEVDEESITARESTHRWPQFMPDGDHFI
jgi:hypothetical protein